MPRRKHPGRALAAIAAEALAVAGLICAMAYGVPLGFELLQFFRPTSPY